MRIGLRRFIRSEDGSVFIFVGLAIVVLMGVAAIAIDLGTQSIIKTRMQNAADAAAVGGAVADNVDNAQRMAIARRYFALNYPDEYLGTDLTAANVGITTSGDSVLVDTNMRQRKADLLPIIDRNTIEMQAVSEVQNTGSSQADIRDITLVMDASGSMGYEMGDASRIIYAKQAARVVIDEVLCAHPGSGSRIGWVQYSSQCNDGAGTVNGTQCVDVSEWLALSGSCNALRSQLNRYVERSATNGAEGLERAETLMGAARPNVVRAVVYMTDGRNNTYRDTDYCRTFTDPGCVGDYSPMADVPARQACNRLKASGILVYTVSYSPDAQHAQIMRDCASGPDYYFYAPDAVTLKSAFQQIVTSIKRIRITR